MDCLYADAFCFVYYYQLFEVMNKCYLLFSYILDGIPRMRERPIGDLVTGLKQLGADVECTLGTNCPPVYINGKGGLPGGKVWLKSFCIMFLWFYIIG